MAAQTNGRPETGAGRHRDRPARRCTMTDRKALVPKTRHRRTDAERAEVENLIYDVCHAEKPITVRGVFYRPVSTGLIAKTEDEYRFVQRLVLKMRRAGDLPYLWISDGSRLAHRASAFGDVEEALDDLASSYTRALWQDQDVQVEVWSEKDAISGVVHQVTHRWQVPLLVAREFASETFLWNSAEVLNANDKPAVILNLGDHDPSGVKAWEDVRRKLESFAEADTTFTRVAVTPALIDELDLPTRPTKTSSHSTGWEGESVEVDAVPSSTLRNLLEAAIVEEIDERVFRIHRQIQAEEREGLRALAEGWRS